MQRCKQLVRKFSSYKYIFFLIWWFNITHTNLKPFLFKVLANAVNLFIPSTACTNDTLGTLSYILGILSYMLCLLTEIFQNPRGKGLLKNIFSVIHFFPWLLEVKLLSVSLSCYQTFNKQLIWLSWGITNCRGLFAASPFMYFHETGTACFICPSSL